MWAEGLVKVEGCRGSGAGRYVLAAKDIPAGQVVLTETPVVFGPKQSSELVCVQCCGVLPEMKGCDTCGLPLCFNCSDKGEDLSSNSGHKSECLLFSQNQIKFSFQSPDDAAKVYSLLTVLKLLMKGTLDQFESHFAQRADSPIWIYNEKFVVPLLSQLRDGGPDGQLLFTREIIHEAAGALDTNTFEVKTVDNTGSVTSIGRALYQQSALFNNNCSPSCSRSFSGQEVSFFTIRPVSAGEELTICYTGLLQPTNIRQLVFSQTKHFFCGCDRCRDPTEKGTFLSSLACSSCGENLSGSPPTCLGCGESISVDREEQVLEMCQNLVKRLDGQECMVWLNSLKKLRKFLSVHHYVLVQLKLKFMAHAAKCPDCCNSEVFTSCRDQIQWLFSTLQPGVESKRSGPEWGEEGSKIMFGGDIVKQVIKSKLGNSSFNGNCMEAGTIANLTS